MCYTLEVVREILPKPEREITDWSIMKELLKRKIHDVSTYVKMNSKRPYGECAIVMICTVLLVLSSMMSTDSVNMESTNVDAVGGEKEIAAAPAEAGIRERTNDSLMASNELSVRAADVLPVGGEAKNTGMNGFYFDKNESFSKNMEDGMNESIPDEMQSDFVTASATTEDETAAEADLSEMQPSVTEVAENMETDLSEPAETEPEEPTETDDALEVAAATLETADVSMISLENVSQAVTEETLPVITVETVPEDMVPEISEEEIDVSNGETEVADCADISAEQNTCGLSAADYDALCRIVEAEAGTEGEQGKLLVANVVLNRVAHPSFPGTIEGVITDSGQFSPVQNGSYQSAVATPETISAVNRALSGENISMGALYFKSVRSNAEWGNRTLLYNYGNHNFYL